MNSMTEAASSYFKQVAGRWDSLRSEYFGEEVRQAAITRAYLRPEMIVVDVGAGTGFMAAGLAPLTRQVIAIDASPEMLEVARQNLRSFDNVAFHQADGLSLPLPDVSVDAVFANMYLHHCPNPLAAMREMARVLRPGGRLVLTDLDAHSHQWLKEEMADVWLGFERRQVKAWLKEAGLVNRIVAGSGQTCSSQSANPLITDESGRTAQISIFVAVGTRPVSGARETVRTAYAAQVQAAEGCGCGSAVETMGEGCCGSSTGASCCSGGQDYLATHDENVFIEPGYSRQERSEVPPEAAEMALGCGNPTALAKLKPGEVVLDIGSGAGMDVFLAAQRVGPTGKVIGVDVTPAMIERAQRSAERLGIHQVEFHLGQAEDLPVADESVEVVISNCVINLCEDKGQVFEEAYRVLKEGGRLEVSDIVADGPLPLELHANPHNWAGCVYGALPQREYLELIQQAGFTEIVARRSAVAGEAAGVRLFSLAVSARKRS